MPGVDENGFVVMEGTSGHVVAANQTMQHQYQETTTTTSTTNQVFTTGHLGGGGGFDRLQLLPAYREILRVQRRDGAGIADQGGHGLTPETGLTLGKDRLIDKLRNDAKGIAARDVSGGQNTL